jgi:hypothetical protein
MFYEDPEGDGVVVGPHGPRQSTTKGFISSTEVNRQGGLGLPSFNPKQDLPEVTELGPGDDRILRALGLKEDDDYIGR